MYCYIFLLFLSKVFVTCDGNMLFCSVLYCTVLVPVACYMSPRRTKGMPSPLMRARARSVALRPRWFVMQSIWEGPGMGVM